MEYALSSQDYVDQFIPLIRSELLTNNSLTDLIEKLETISTEKNLELQKLSYDSIDDITQSIGVIENIINSSNYIAKEVVVINRSINKSSKLLLDDKIKLQNLNQSNIKILDTNDKINSCLEILGLTNKIIELIKNENFYKALISLKNLSNYSNVDNFEFINRFFQSIPNFEILIIDETFNQLNKWLNLNIEKNLSEFGELLFNNFININDNWIEKQEKSAYLINYKVNSSVEISFRSRELKFFNPLNSLNIDLKPLYHSMLVFNELNQLNKLKEYLNNDIVRRIDHLFIPIKESLNKSGLFSSIESLKINLYSITSFSIIDKLINEFTNYQLRSLDDINLTFSTIQNKFLPILTNYIDACKFEFDDLLEINEIFGIYYQILSNYNFNCNSVYKLMIKIFNKFLSKNIEVFKKQYTYNSLNDNSQSLIIHTNEELKEVQDSLFSFNNSSPLPIHLPYSRNFIDTYRLIKTFINQIYSFINKYYVSDNNLNYLINKSIDDILTNIILKDLDDKIKSTYKEVVSQNLINLDYYLLTIKEIEEYLNAKNSNKNSAISLTLSINEFKKTRRSAIESMFNLIDIKIHSLFEMLDFDWDSSELKTQPDTSIIDLIEFLQDSFKLNFSHLPDSIKSLLLLKIFDKISKFLIDSIMEVHKISSESVSNFAIDLNFIENSISNFQSLNNEPLKELFIKLKQILNLLNDGNLDNYKVSEIRLRKFNKVEPDEAVSLVKKLNMEEKDTSLSTIETSQDDVRSIFGGLKRSGTLFKK